MSKATCLSTTTTPEHRRIPSVGSKSHLSDFSVEYCSDRDADSEAVMLDHAYASTDTPSLDTSSCLVSDLASLIENCELDANFIESAASDTANFQHFLDDVISDSDVPADDILVGLLDDSGPQLVPTKSSCLHAQSTDAGCLFSCARGSTETRLCSSFPSSMSSVQVGFCAPLSAAAPHENSQPEEPSPPAPAPLDTGLATSSPCLSSSSTSSLTEASVADVMMYTEGVLSEDKIKDLLDWLAVGNGCSSLPDATLDLDVGPYVSDLDHSPLIKPSAVRVEIGRQQEYCSSCLSVSVSHQIENGVCLLCSAARSAEQSNSLRLSLAFSDLMSPGRVMAVTETEDDHDTGVISPSGKRKSVCGDSDEKSERGAPKRVKLDSACEQTDRHDTQTAQAENTLHNLHSQQPQSTPDHNNNNDSLCDQDTRLAKLRSGDMLGFLSHLATGLPTDARWRSW